MNILIIEDDKLVLHSLSHIIESLGHVVVLAEDAEIAMQNITSKKFDLIFSDIMMPGISGLSLLTILRSAYRCSTPIIAMSSLNHKPLLEAAFQAGANDFMTKPFSVEDLSGKINKFNEARA
jgi:CheY-like chemotaxis protein